MTLFVPMMTTNLSNDSDGTKASDETTMAPAAAAAARDGKVQKNVRRRVPTMDVAKSGIRMDLLQCSALGLLVFFALCASLTSAARPPQRRQQQQQQRDAALLGDSTVRGALDAPLQYASGGPSSLVLDERLLPYAGPIRAGDEAAAVVGETEESNNNNNNADDGFLDANAALQKRILVPPRRMLNMAQLMNNSNKQKHPPSAVGDETAEQYNNNNNNNSNEGDEEQGARWRQNNGGMWAKRHIKDSTSPAGFQKMDEFKNNMMRALINLRRYRR